LCRLCALWKKSVHSLDIAVANEELLEWGPTTDELLSANIAEVTAAWGDTPMEDDDDGEDDQNLDREDEMDIGLINALEAVDLADAYRSSGYDDDIQFVDDIQF